MIDGHHLECARAAIALLIEKAPSRQERSELRAWLREIEDAAVADCASSQSAGQPQKMEREK